MKKKKVQKAANGLSNILGSGTSGALTGSQFGPWGALAGGVLGAGMGVLNTLGENKQEEAQKKLLARQAQESMWATAGMDNSSMSQLNQYAGGSKGIKPNQVATQDNTASKSMYKTTPSSGKGGFSDLKRTTKGATAILGLAKAIPTPFTQAIGWGASALSAGIGLDDAVNNTRKGNYKQASMDVAGAALDVVPLNVSKAGKVGKTIDLLKKGSKARNMRSATNVGVRAAQVAALANDAGDVLDASSYRQGTSGVKPIEIEGGEPHFSKKDSSGKRTLKMFAPNGPTHEQGGIPVVAQSGDAIVTAKGNKGALAVAAHQSGDHATVEKIIKQMPADKGSKKAKGGLKGIKYIPKDTPTADMVLGVPGSTVADRARQIGQPFRDNDISLDIYNKNNAAYLPKATTPGSGILGGLQSAAPTALGALATAAPTLYNLGQGIFGNTAKTTRRSFNPQTLAYEDMSGASRQAVAQGVNGNIATARNVSGGNAGNVRANAAQAYATGVSQNTQINSQESERKLGVMNTNTNIRNDAQLRNNAMNDQADQLDLQNAAKKQEALSKGLEGISGLTQNSQLMGNQQAADEANKTNLSQMFRNLELVDGKWQVRKLPTKRKGVKKIK